MPDPESKSVYIYDADGNLLLIWNGEGAQTLSSPWSVVTDSDDNMYVVDHGRSMLSKVHINF